MNLLRKIILRVYPKIIMTFYKYYNKCLLSLWNAEVGQNPRIFNKLYIRILEGGKLKIGNNFTFTSGGGLNPLSRNIRGYIFIDRNAKITIGNNTGISSASLRAKKEIIIGNYVDIGADSILIDTDSHNLDWKVRAGMAKDINGNTIGDGDTANAKTIIIEDNVLIGTRCIILKGVTIGARSIIAAGSVVTKSIPADCIAGGNPCRVIKYINTGN